MATVDSWGLLGSIGAWIGAAPCHLREMTENGFVDSRWKLGFMPYFTTETVVLVD
jgi:hypothetical protein